MIQRAHAHQRQGLLEALGQDLVGLTRPKLRLGWLCEKTTAAALSRSASYTTSRGYTVDGENAVIR